MLWDILALKAIFWSQSEICLESYEVNLTFFANTRANSNKTELQESDLN